MAQPSLRWLRRLASRRVEEPALSGAGLGLRRASLVGEASGELPKGRQPSAVLRDGPGGPPQHEGRGSPNGLSGRSRGSEVDRQAPDLPVVVADGIGSATAADLRLGGFGLSGQSPRRGLLESSFRRLSTPVSRPGMLVRRIGTRLFHHGSTTFPAHDARLAMSPIRLEAPILPYHDRSIRDQSGQARFALRYRSHPLRGCD